MIAFQQEPDPIFLAIVDEALERFFFDTDFLMGATLLAAEEAAPGQLLVTR